MALNLITNRTEADLTRLQELAQKAYEDMTTAEKAEWNSPHKGAYNYTDLNRVESAVATLAAQLNGYGYTVEVTVKTNWTRQDVPTELDTARYLQNITAIRSALAVMQSTPQVPADMVGFSITEANNIEKILLDVEQLISNMQASFIYSNEIYGGELG